MSKNLLFAFGLYLLCGAANAAANDYGYLKNLEPSRNHIAIEKDYSVPFFSRAAQPVDADLSSYWTEFAKDKKVSVFVGYGKDAWDSGRPTELMNEMKSIASSEGLSTDQWAYDSATRTISFKDTAKEVAYSVVVGNERDQYAKAFANYEIVMYHGHSRWGQGPAFGEYQNYFRMGDVYSFIEIDTRNKYFQNESTMRLSQFPLITEDVGGQTLSYQYRDEKEERSYLPAGSYVRNIPGGDVDFKNATFLPGKQIIYLYSCRNMYYFKNPIRARFPDVQNKFVFGTHEDGYWATAPEAVMIMSAVKGVAQSTEIVNALNGTNDCSGCFTSY